MTEIKELRGKGTVDRRQFLKYTGLGAVTAGAALGLPRGPAWALSKSDVENASGTVKVLVWEGYEDPNAFAELDDITIEAGYLAANEDTITKTQPAGAFDILTIYQGMIDPLIKVKRAEPIDTSLLSNFDQLYPFFRNADGFRRNGDVYAVPYTWGTMMVLYDADAVDQPKSFDDLMSSKLTGKIAMPDDAYACITTFARYAGFDDANSLTHDQLDKTMALLRKFKPQLLAVAPGYGELPAMFARREILLSVPDWTPSAMAAQDAGVNVQTTIPEEGAFSFVDSWMRVTGSKNPAGGYAVINESIGVAAQSVIGVVTGLGIVNPGAVPALGDAVAEAWHYDQIESTFAKAPLYPGVPLESDGDVATLDEWLAAWTDFKAA